MNQVSVASPKSSVETGAVGAVLQAQEPTKALPRVVFIVGSGRSGTTLLDLLLGHQEGVFSAGEIARLWNAGIAGDQLCGCGQRPLSCPVWGPAIDHAYETTRFTNEDLETLAEAIAGERQRLQGSRSLSGESRYGRAYQALVTCAAEIAGCDVLVDSSKRPGDGSYLRSNANLPINVVLIVRRCAAVAFSWGRVVSMNDSLSPRQMGTRGVRRAALQWASFHLQCAWRLASHRSDLNVVDYDELVNSPVGLISETLGTSPKEVRLPTAIPENHTLGGSRTRMQAGRPLVLRADNEWQQAMSRRNRLFCAIAAVPARVSIWALRGKRALK